VTIGHIVVLNGPSSAGKTTLADAVRARVGPTLATVSIDRLFPFMHQALPTSWHVFATLTDAVFRCAAAIADGGFDVVVDTVFERASCIDIMRTVLGQRSFSVVAIAAPLHVLEARERERGDRRIGHAREQQERGVLHGTHYDGRLDTDAQSVDSCVDLGAALLCR
jgi:chloramphenicol 3-O phosphotransferase